MKKIVALVLSLVMVLGLATVAFAADPSYNLDGVYASDMKTQAFDADLNSFTVKAAKDSYIDKDTVLHGGNVKYYVLDQDTSRLWVPCTADTEGAIVLYYKDTKVVFDTVVETSPNYDAVGTAYTNLGTACGQVDNSADKTAKYYTYVGSYGVPYVVKEAEGTGRYLLVAGELVEVATTPSALNAHKWVVEKDAKNNVTGATCALCDLYATFTLNKAAVPTGAISEQNFGGYLYWNAAPVATTPSTDKVESAQTFDAGIAMYVGMSVMAAAGSAVVLKKKD